MECALSPLDTRGSAPPTSRTLLDVGHGTLGDPLRRFGQPLEGAVRVHDIAMERRFPDSGARGLREGTSAHTGRHCDPASCDRPLVRRVRGGGAMTLRVTRHCACSVTSCVRRGCVPRSTALAIGRDDDDDASLYHVRPRALAPCAGTALGGVCPGDGDCFASNGTPGCNDASCCLAVCAIDSFCCDTSWDGICAGEAADICLPPCPGVCFGDLNNTGGVDGADLGLLLGNWSGAGCGDLNVDGTVNGADLGLLLGAWGPCPGECGPPRPATAARRTAPRSATMPPAATPSAPSTPSAAAPPGTASAPARPRTSARSAWRAATRTPATAARATARRSATTPPAATPSAPSTPSAAAPPGTASAPARPRTSVRSAPLAATTLLATAARRTAPPSATTPPAATPSAPSTRSAAAPPGTPPVPTRRQDICEGAPPAATRTPATAAPATARRSATTPPAATPSARSTPSAASN